MMFLCLIDMRKVEILRC